MILFKEKKIIHKSDIFLLVMMKNCNVLFKRILNDLLITMHAFIFTLKFGCFYGILYQNKDLKSRAYANKDYNNVPEYIGCIKQNQVEGIYKISLYLVCYSLTKRH